MPDPLVTIVVPMRNEADGIAACLESILANHDVAGGFEVLVLDGDSSDTSAAVVAQLAERDSRVRLMSNPDRLQAAAFNRGLSIARGRYFMRVDAHATIPPDYLRLCLTTLERTGAANVGGPIVPSGTGLIGEAIAAAYGTKFGLGHSRHDPSEPEHEVDSVSFGAWRIDMLREVGGMNASLAVNEDYELNYRLRVAGHRIVWHPLIRAEYQVRASLGKLARQYFRYGFWKVRTLLLHPGSLRWRQLVAPVFVLSLLATPFLVMWLGAIGLSHLVLYSLTNLAASVMVARRAGWHYVFVLPLIFLAIHACWGGGFLCGLTYWPFRPHATT